MPETAVARRAMMPVKLAAFIVALALAGVSAAFSIDGLTAIFAGAFWPLITMGAALEAGKLVAAAWLTEHWNSAPPLMRLVLVTMIGVLMGLNAGQRRRAQGGVGPPRYLAELTGAPATDLERPVRWLTLALVAVLDPMAVVLLLAAAIHTTRAGSS